MNERRNRIEAFLEREDITNWQRKFAQSIMEFFDKKGTLSSKQWSTFQSMEAQYSEEVIEARKEWYSQWNEDKANKLKIATEYYKNYVSPQTGQKYFQSAVKRILSDEDYIPSRKQYAAMVENKYVSKIIEMINSKPQFEVGALVQVRRTASGKIYKLRDRVAMVVSNDGPVLSPAKGAKTYTILPFGESQTIEIQERYLKRKRGK